MKGEMTNLEMAFVMVVVSMTYCYFISSRIPKGNKRLISLLPVISIFNFLPLLFSSILLQFYFGLFIAWFTSFKLLLFAFGKDDTLSVDPSMPLLPFIVMTTFPIKIKRNQKTPPKSTITMKLDVWSVLNPVMWYVVIQLEATYTQHTSTINPMVIRFLYTIRLFFTVQLHTVFFGAIGKLLVKQEIERQFNAPLLPSSLQNFWGKRWNLISSDLLKSTVYIPTRTYLNPLLGRWALHPAIILTFMISGLMHELLYFYVGMQKPTMEVTWFFLIHGICVALEIEAKKKASEIGWKLHRVTSTLLTGGFVAVTAAWLCFAELIHCGADAREISEYTAWVDYIKSISY